MVSKVAHGKDQIHCHSLPDDHLSILLTLVSEMTKLNCTRRDRDLQTV